MKKLLVCLLGTSVLLAGRPSASAAALGDAAAPLEIAEWVKGQAVDLAAVKGKKIVVVEFWATWCPPCRASIPHLTELQKKFKDKDVVFVGVSNEKLATVKPFVEKMGEKMDYVVAVDKEQKTSAGYMEAFKIEGIPHAFIVDKKGLIVWEGHPMADLEQTLEQVVAGKYDLSLGKKRARGEQLLQQFAELLNEGKDEAKANELAKEIEAIDKEVGGLMPGQKFDAVEVRKMIKFRSAMSNYQQAITEGKDDAEVEKLAQAAEGLAPKDVNFAAIRQQFQLQTVFQSYMKAASGDADEAKVAELGKKLGAVESKNPDLLNEIAWVLLTDKSIKKRDLPLALKLAKSAADASAGKDAAILDTYARALFDNGKVDDAIATQKKALELSKNPNAKEEMEAALKNYQAKPAAK